MTTVSALPTAPSRTDPATFAARGDAWVAALATWTTEVNTVASEINAALLHTERTVSSGSTLVESDRGKLVNCTAALTLGTTAAATLGNGWWCIVRNTGTGNVTVDPNSSETIDGQTSGLIYPNFVVMILCTGSTFFGVRLDGRRTEVLTSGTTYTHQAIGVRRIRAKLVGGGGSGRRGTSGASGCGSAGGYCEGEFAVTLGTAYTYAIGAGGGSLGSDNSNGAAGSATTFNNGVVTLTANGGAAGTTATSQMGGTASNGDINLPGGSTYGNATGTYGGNSMMGIGGVANFGGSPLAATGYGSGGGASANGTASGAGMPGVIVLEM